MALGQLDGKYRDSLQTFTMEGVTVVSSPGISGTDYPKEFKVKKVDNGFLVEIGCKTLVFASEKELFEAQKLYFKDPEKAEKKYLGGK